MASSIQNNTSIYIGNYVKSKKCPFWIKPPYNFDLPHFYINPGTNELYFGILVGVASEIVCEGLIDRLQ